MLGTNANFSKMDIWDTDALCEREDEDNNLAAMTILRLFYHN